MRNYAFCPVSPKVVNNRVARLNAAFTTLLVILFLLTFNVYIMAFLFADFFLRAIDQSSFSPLAITSKGVLKTLSLKPLMINAGPKLFAARVGLVFCGGVLVLFVWANPTSFVIVASVLGVFSFLEAVFGLCVACKIYPFLYRWLYPE
jgi:hypothetical protein